MKSYVDLTNRYMKSKKTRTLLTLLGIILSIAMIVSIGNLTLSVKATIVRERERKSGSYDGMFKNLEREKLNKLRYHVDIERVGVSERVGYIKLDKAEENVESVQYIDLKAYDETGIKLNEFSLLEGRYPRNSNEIVIEKSNTLFINQPLLLEDKINVTIGQLNDDVYEETGKKNYIVVGFIRNRNMVNNGLTSPGITLTNNDSKRYDVYFNLKDRSEPYWAIDKIGEDLGIKEENIVKNHELLDLFTKTRLGTRKYNVGLGIALIIGLIIISSSAVIYNSFNISIIERIEEFGLLRSIGATPSQIRMIVYKEASILSLVGIPLGVFVGIKFIDFVINHIERIESSSYLVENLQRVISPKVTILSCFLGLVMIFLSSLGPAFKAGKTTVIDNIKGNVSPMNKQIKNKKLNLILRDKFGIETEIAYKNLGRNRSRFFITIFSMVVSLVLFISFSTFLDMTFKVQSKVENLHDFRVIAYNGDMMDFWESALDYNENISNVDIENLTYLQILDGYEKLSQRFIDDDIINNDFSLKSTDLEGINKEGLVGGNLEDKGLVMILDKRYIRQDNIPFKLGEEINFRIRKNTYDDQFTQAYSLPLVGIVEGPKKNFKNNRLEFIVSESTWEDIKEKTGFTMYLREFFINIKDEKDLEDVRMLMDEMKNVTLIDYFDYREFLKEEKAMYSIISMLLYGFVFIITLISFINIFNTISTNIVLRNREINILRAIGMSNKAIVKMVSIEGLLYTLYSAVIGGIVSTIIIFTVFGGKDGQYLEYGLILIKNIFMGSIGFSIISLVAANYPLFKMEYDDLSKDISKSI